MTGKPQRLFFVRHGLRRDTVDPLWAASADEPHDPPLCERGLAQADAVGRSLRGQSIEAVYSSPFLRALQTADAIAASLGLPVCVEPAFGEWLNPQWMSARPALLDERERKRRFPRVDDTYQPRGRSDFPEVDETREVRSRVCRAMEALWRDFPGQPFVVVSHGSPLGQLMAWMVPGVSGLNLDVASITRIDRARGGCRLMHSGVEHLQTLGDDPMRAIS